MTDSKTTTFKTPQPPLGIPPVATPRKQFLRRRKKNWWSATASNPGTYEDLTKEYNAVVLPLQTENLEGLQVVLHRQLRRLTVQHQFSMGNTVENEGETPASYGLTLSYQTPFATSVVGRVTTDGLTNARVVWRPWNWTILKGSLTTSTAANAAMFEGEIYTKLYDFTTQLRYISKNNVFMLNYSQGITKRLSAGIEGMYFSNKGKSLISGSVRALAPDELTVWTLRLTSLPTLEMTCTQVLWRFLRTTTSWSMMLQNRDQNAQLLHLLHFGYQYKFGAATNVRGFYTSSHTMAVQLEEQVGENLQININMSVNYPQNIWKFGLGLNFSGI
eukprot:TRINITY_DN2371_c0_g1_i5.p1 TRINITY_DN2371_c0_g1~~TRINITY_DN2371_c0_g1_i5.p1  ORF type:complete len:331 (+),score=35.82 TRINITY_DN2371_c0_g1_i5:79-1071(+)